MSEKDLNHSRRTFLKSVGAAGVVSVLGATRSHATEEGDKGKFPTRPFGNTGIKVPILALGGAHDLRSNQLLLKQALEQGVAYWDTAHSYSGGNSEIGMGKFFKKYPKDRKKIFLVTKSEAWTRMGMTSELNESLERLNTDYVDLFFAHAIDNIKEMDKGIRKWAEKAKSEGKIRFFGFSTHSNMEECLLGASKLGWIDGIMMSYNFRLMNTDPMRKAVDACFKAGIGLTAMKTQGGGQVETDTETEMKLAGRFLKKGFTDAQAKLKAVWENPKIASICSHMPNLTILMSNMAAAQDKTKISTFDRKLLDSYAAETRGTYCSGCTNLCETALNGVAPVGNIMRYLMYSRTYGESGRARACFKKISSETRSILTHIDYSEAEKACPQGINISRFVHEAVQELA